MARFRFVLALPLVAALTGCAEDKRATTPEAAVNKIIAAARLGDRQRVYEYLGPKTRARIEAIANSAHRTTGRATLKPEDFLSVGWAPPAWDPTGTRTIHKGAESAELEVYSSRGDRQTVTAVRQGGEWKVELPGL